jgi:hypothetical protein
VQRLKRFGFLLFHLKEASFQIPLGVYVTMMNQSLDQQFIQLGVYCLGKDDQTIT